MIGILDFTVALRGGNFCIATAGDSIKFHYPILKAHSSLDLAWPEFVGFFIPGQNRLSPGSASWGPDSENIIDCFSVVVTGEDAAESGAFVKDLVCQVDETCDLNCALAGRRSECGWLELESPHAATADIAEAFHWMETRYGSSLWSKPGVNDRVTVFVWKWVCNQSRQPFEGVPCKRRELIGEFAKRHHERCQLNTAAQEVRRVLEDPDLPVFKPRDGTDYTIPENDACIIIHHRPRRYPTTKLGVHQ